MTARIKQGYNHKRSVEFGDPGASCEVVVIEGRKHLSF